MVFERKSYGKCPGEAAMGFVSLATRFQHLLDEGNHRHRLPLLGLREIQASLCVSAGEVIFLGA